ncbi:hypothetical protein MKOR_12560 [Mycolicibacillus koreensis]|nr:hypothetical protein MKOR_12560 [Mycolicibacillus koreensis]
MVAVHGNGRYDIRLDNGLEAGADPEQQRADGVSAGELALVKRKDA